MLFGLNTDFVLGKENSTFVLCKENSFEQRFFSNFVRVVTPSSYIKTPLKFKARENPKVSNLKVSSHSEKCSNFENQNNNFRVKIPPNLNFNQPNLHVGVSSITFPNRFRTLPSKTQKYMCIITLQEDLKISNIKKVLVPE